MNVLQAWTNGKMEIYEGMPAKASRMRSRV